MCLMYSEPRKRKGTSGVGLTGRGHGKEFRFCSEDKSLEQVNDPILFMWIQIILSHLILSTDREEIGA